MPLSDRENYIRNATWTGPEWIPCTVVVSGASWKQLGSEAEEVLARHPTLFPDFKKGDRCFGDYAKGSRAGDLITDNWGCRWRCEIDGIVGIVEGHPLADWLQLETYQPPDPRIQADDGPMDWEGRRRQVEIARQEDQLAVGTTAHGFFFMRLYYLRGFENLMMDFGAGDPRLKKLIKLLVEYNQGLVKQWLSLGVDLMDFGDDLGTQISSVLSPSMFHEWITPAYKSLMQPCRDAGCLVALHSDGHIMDLIDEFLEAGVNIINPQDLVNGIDNLAKEVKGRLGIRLDIDRQKIVPYGTRKEIRDLVEEEVRKLGSSQGGLELIAGIYPPTPAENVDALCCALEEFRTFWWK